MGMSANGPQLDAWRAVVTSHAAVTDRIQKALAAADLPPLSWFEMLSAVKSSPTGRPRMSELAEWLTLSRGGITKLVDRLEEAGYLERVSCAEDRRALQAELTAAGEKYALAAGDVVAFRGDQKHSYANPGKSRAVGYSVVVIARVP